MATMTDGTTNTRELINEQIDSVVDMLDAYNVGELTEYAKNQEWETDNYALDDEDYEFSVLDYLADALDVSILTPNDDAGVSHVEVLLTVGGPYLSLRRDFSGTRIVCSWGGTSEYQWHVALDEFLDEVVDIVTGN